MLPPALRDGLPPRVAKVLAALIVLEDAEEALLRAHQERRRLGERANSRAAQASLAAVRKAQRKVTYCEKQLSAVEARVRPSDIATARDLLAQQRRAESRARPSPRPQPPVTVRFVAPTVEPSESCRRCGKKAQLRAQGSCGVCLKQLGLEPCPHCGVWLTREEARRHACASSRTSVRTVSGGAPTLGRRSH